MYRKEYTVKRITENAIILLDWRMPRTQTVLPIDEFAFILNTVEHGRTISITWDNEKSAASYTVPRDAPR
jgi:hypothetical protein